MSTIIDNTQYGTQDGHSFADALSSVSMPHATRLANTRLVLLRARISSRALLVTLVGLLIATNLNAGNWGEPWGQLLWGPRPQTLPPGLVMYAPTSELNAGVDSCYALLAHLGGPTSVRAVTSLIAANQTTTACQYDAGGTAVGNDYPLSLGQAYLLNLVQPVNLIPGPPPGCPATRLETGVNLIGVGVPAAGLSCFDLLTAFAPGNVSTVERLSSDGKAFESCAVGSTANVIGSNFSIAAGVGYLVHSESGTGDVNLNDLADPACDLQ